MFQRSNILKLSAALLLCVFSLKAVVRLELHNALHTNKTQSSTTEHTSGKFAASCTCLDDFLTPFTETEEQQLVFNSQSFQTLTSVYNKPLIHVYPVYTSLRAPPFC